MENKKYAFLEVGGENCKFRSRNVLIQSVKYFCRVDYDDCDIEHCKNCPHGKTLSEMGTLGSEGIHNIFGILTTVHGNVPCSNDIAEAVISANLPTEEEKTK